MKKLLALLLCLVMLISFAACAVEEGSSDENDDAQNEEQTELSSVEQIKQSGKLRLGTSADYPPFEYHMDVDGQDTIVGFVNDIATDRETITDEMFTDIVEHKPDGAYLMILGLDVRPQYRHRGYAGMLLRRLIENARREGRRGVGLTCHDFLVPYYSSFGFRDLGVSASVWGGETWYDMRIDF